MFRKKLVGAFVFATLAACSEHSEEITPVELAFDADHIDSQQPYAVKAKVLLAGASDAVLPDVVIQRAREMLTNSLRYSIGAFFPMSDTGLTGKDARYAGVSICESARLEMKIIQKCEVQEVRWKKK